LCLSIGFFSCGVWAQDRFDTDDMTAHAGYRGYTTYRAQTQENESRRAALAQDRMQAQPILNQHFITTTAPTSSDLESEMLINKDHSASRLEQFYRDRTGDQTLRQFGYDLFTTAPQLNLTRHDEGKRETHTTPAGAVQGSYIIQPGDEVTVIFTGERRGRDVITVGSDGRLIIDGLNPLMAAGRSVNELKNAVTVMTQDLRYRGSVEVAISAMKQIGVLVAGHVHHPGRQNLNATQSVLDALNSAGGIRKTGSLRHIKLIRQGSSSVIDLYQFLVFAGVGGSGQAEITLQDGDRIIVPPVGQSFAVTGDVKQVGIFELPPQNRETLTRALTMAGGVLGGGDIRYALKHPDGRVVNLGRASNPNAAITDGAIVMVTRATDRLSNAIELKGYSRANGLYDLGSAGTLHQLLRDGRILADDTYPLMGVVSRMKRDRLTRHLMGFSPQTIARGEDDRQLEAGDIVYLFSQDDIAAIIEKGEGESFPKSVRDYVMDHGITIQGAIRNQGLWPVGTVTDLQILVAVAGGLTAKASRSDIEITTRHTDLGNTHRRRKINVADIRLSEVMLEPGDQVRVNERFEQAVDKTVKITGEVKNPGHYDLMRGDTLLSLIDRAGGLTMDAYPPAAVFSRKSERKREEQRFRSAAQELERTVSVNLNAVDKGSNLTPAQISMARKLADDLRAVQAIGRVTVEADPTVLSVRPELNMLLEDGDHLHIPKRTLNVRISGEVMNPVNALFEEEKDVSDYIREAGGKSYYADSDRIFVVYPDGAAQPVRGSGWQSHRPAMVIPGSTIIVPRDPKPFNFMESFKDITQILTNMAITGVFIEDIATDEN